MSKEKRTLKAIRAALARNDQKAYAVPYANLQFLLRFQEPTAYHAGIYGWNFDEYDFGNISIFTGYRLLPGTKIPSKILNEYEHKAEKLLHERTSYESAKQAIDALLAEFLQEIQTL